MSNPVGIGVVGLGRIGLAHATWQKRLSDLYRVVAIADSIPERQEEAKTTFGCRAYASCAELVKDAEVEAVVIATPTCLHKQNAVEAFAAGKHVVCDKPVACSLAELDVMIAAGKAAGKLFTVYQNMRFDATFLKVREVIQSGQLGRIVQVRRTGNNFERRWDWQTLKEFGGGRLFNHGIHLLDQVLQLMASPEPEVFAHLDRTLWLGDADDHVKLMLRAPGDPVVDVELSCTCAFPCYDWLVMGTQGTLRSKRREVVWKYLDPGQFTPQTVERTAPANRGFDRCDEEAKLPWQIAQWDGQKAPHPMPWYYRALYATLRQGAPPVVTVDSVRRVMVVVEKCHQQTGNRYRLVRK